MNINDFVRANTAKTYLGLQSSTQAAGSVNSAGQAGLQKAEKRIQSQVDITTTQLSSVGKLKSSVSGTQLAAQTLANMPVASTSAAVKTATDGFVSAFNSAISAANVTAGVPGESAVSRSAGRVAKDLTRTVSENTETIASLKKIGFSLQSNGSLTLDAKKFDEAQKADPTGVRATLTKIGQQVDKAAAQELATAGNVSNSMASLNQRAAVLKNQQSTIASLQKVPSTNQSSSSPMYGGFGAASYQSY